MYQAVISSEQAADVNAGVTQFKVTEVTHLTSSYVMTQILSLLLHHSTPVTLNKQCLQLSHSE